MINGSLGHNSSFALPKIKYGTDLAKDRCETFFFSPSHVSKYVM
jgi:hypothetical protein